MREHIKKINAIILALALLFLVSGCGNMSLGLGNFTFEKVHIDTYHYSGCFSVEKWYENGSGIEVKTKEAGAMFLSEGTYILLEGDTECPLCEKGGEGE